MELFKSGKPGLVNVTATISIESMDWISKFDFQVCLVKMDSVVLKLDSFEKSFKPSIYLFMATTINCKPNSLRWCMNFITNRAQNEAKLKVETAGNI